MWHSGTLVPADTWAPIIMVAGSKAVHGSRANFTKQVRRAAITVGTMHRPHKRTSFVWGGHAYEFFPSNGPGLDGDPHCFPGGAVHSNPASKGRPACAVTQPTVDGVTVNIAPKKAYDGPHLHAVLGSQVVTAKYTDAYTVTYDFSTDSITTSRKPSAVAAAG